MVQPPAEIMQRAAKPGLFPVHHGGDLIIRSDHHVADSRVAPDDTFGAVGRGHCQHAVKDVSQQFAFALGIDPVDIAPPAVRFLIKPVRPAGQCEEERIGHRHSLDGGQLADRASPDGATVGGRGLHQPAGLGVRRIADRDAAMDLFHHEEGRAEDRSISLEPKRLGDADGPVPIHQFDNLILLHEQIIGIDGIAGRLDPHDHTLRFLRPGFAPRGVEQDRFMRHARTQRITEIGDADIARTLKARAEPTNQRDSQLIQRADVGGDDGGGVVHAFAATSSANSAITPGRSTLCETVLGSSSTHFQ